MTIKGSRSASPKPTVVVPDSAGMTLPNGDWSIGFLAIMDGTVNGDGNSIQYVFRTGEYGQAGGLIFAYCPIGGPNSGRFFGYVNGGGSATVQAGASVVAGGAYVVVMSRVNGSVRTRICPILQTEPTDGSAVIKNTDAGGADVSGLGSALDGPADMMICNRNDGNRGFDNSLGRLFRIDRALTDLEVAQLAWGKEITDLGTPAWYFKFKTNADIGDYGPSAYPTTVNGTFTTGTAPNFGYVAPSGDVAATIAGKPVITGTVQVGQTVGYTPATSAGSPSPTRTQQWTRDGADISGATTSTYALVAADDGKTLAVRQIASNTVNGTPVSVSSTSTGVVVQSAPVVPTIDAAEQIAERIYQQIGGVAVVAMSGTYSGLTVPSKVEYRLYTADKSTVIKPWANAGATIGGGTWTANPSLPLASSLVAGNRQKYYIEFRSTDASGNVLATSGIKNNRFGVGAIFGCIGSSSAYSWFTGVSGNTYTPNVASTSRMTLRDGGSGWGNLSNDGCATSMAEYLSQKLVMPVAMMHYGQSGVTLVTWVDTSSTSWTMFRDGVTAVGGEIAGVFVSVGSNDAASNGLVSSKAQHLARMRQLVTNVRTHAGQAGLPFLWSGFNRRTSGAYMPGSDYVRQAENDIGDDSGVYHVQALDYELSSDGIHLSAAGFSACGQRMQYVFGEVLTGGTYYRGPKLTSITWSGSTFTAKLQHRGSTDFAPASGITGFTITDADSSGVAPSVTSVMRTDANTITGTFSRAIVGTPSIKYLSGVAPEVGTPVYGNGATALPMVVETEMVATQSSDATAPVMIGSLGVSSVTSTGAVLAWSAATDAVGVTGYERSLDSGTNYADIGNVTTLTLASLSASTTYNVRVRAYDAAGNRATPLAAIVTTTSALDTTAPTLSSATASPTGQTTAGGSVTTSEAGGTLYRLASRNATESAATVKAGQSSAISAAGAQSVSFAGLAAGTTYYGHFLHRDAAGNESAVANTAAFTTAAESPANVSDFTPSSSRTLKVLPGHGFSAEGAFWDLSNPDKPVGTMDPGAVLDIPLDWTPYLVDIGSPAIGNATITVGGVQNTSPLGRGNLTILFASAVAGAAGAVITFKIATATTPQVIDERTVYLKFEDK